MYLGISDPLSNCMFKEPTDKDGRLVMTLVRARGSPVNCSQRTTYKQRISHASELADGVKTWLQDTRLFEVLLDTGPVHADASEFQEMILGSFNFTVAYDNVFIVLC
jgi:hypothetical protein